MIPACGLLAPEINKQKCLKLWLNDAAFNNIYADWSVHLYGNITCIKLKHIAIKAMPNKRYTAHRMKLISTSLFSPFTLSWKKDITYISIEVLMCEVVLKVIKWETLYALVAGC